MRHDILSVASQDLTDGVIYYEDRSPGLGLDFLDEYESTLSRIFRTPEGWRQISPRHRRCRFRRFPFAIIYTQFDDLILVTGVMDMRKDPQNLIERIKNT